MHLSRGVPQRRFPRVRASAAALALAAAPAAGSPPAEEAELRYPVDVAVSASGEIFVADIEAASLLKWAGSGFEVVTAGEGLPRTPLFGIRHIAPDDTGGSGGAGSPRSPRSIIASDPATMALYRLSPDGAIEKIPDDDRFVTPWGVAVLPSGEILAVDRVTRRLRRVGPDSEVEDVLDITAPRAILAEPDGALHILTDRNLLRIENGAAEPLILSPPFEFPHDFARAADGAFFVTDGYARCIWRVSPEGRVSVLTEGAPLVSPQGIAADASGELLVADAQVPAIFRISPDTGEVRRLGE